MSLNIHNNIIKKLDYFIDKTKIPHIIFMDHQVVVKEKY